MYLDIATDNATQCPNELVNLARVCAADGVGDAHAVDADLVYGLIDG